jgi:pectinesterase
MKKYVFITMMILGSHLLFAQKRVTVALDGSGNYTTVQAALDAVPVNNKKPITIYIKNGIYKEKLHLDAAKNNVRLIGEDKFNTVLTYDDHTGKIASNGETINTRTSWSFIVKADDFKAENIAFQNDAGFNAGQAVAVEVQGDKTYFKNCRFLGFQDVLFTNSDKSRQYYKDCYIEGTTDFIFGAATALFDGCHIHSKKNSHVTAASTIKERPYGYVFYDCVLTADSSLYSVSLGRPWQPYASVTYLHCYIGQHIIPGGWDNWKNPANEKTARYAEYKNYGPGGNITNRVSWSKQLTDAEAKNYTWKNIFGDWQLEECKM